MQIKRRSAAERAGQLLAIHVASVHGANKRGRIFVRNAAPFEGYTDGRHKQIIDG
jgi:hypothetical protein